MSVDKHFLIRDVPHLIHPEVEAGHDGAAADDGGHGGPLAQDEVGQQHIEHRGQAPVHDNT